MSNNPICPYMQGGLEGARCLITASFIRDTDGADIHICVSEHFRYCSILRCYNDEQAV